MRVDAKVQTQLDALIPQLFEADRLFSKQSGLADHEPGSLVEVLGPPARASDIAALEKRIGRPLPPSYVAFLSLHSHWLGCPIGGDLLGPRELKDPQIRQTAAFRGRLFEESGLTDPFANGALSLTSELGNQFVLMERSARRHGQWDFVQYEHCTELARFSDLVTLLRAQLKQLTGALLKPVRESKKLSPVLEKMSNTSSTGLGRDLRLKWQKGLLESVEIRSERNEVAVAELVKMPAARGVKTLIIGASSTYGKAVKRLADTGWPAQVERFSLGHQRSGEKIPVPNRAGDVAKALNRYAHLTHLDLTLGHSPLSALKLPSVTRLKLRDCTPGQLAVYVKAEWPRLECLALDLSSERTLRAAVSSAFAAPKLTQLEVTLWRDDQLEALVAGLRASVLRKRLVVLRLVASAAFEKKARAQLPTLRIERIRDDER